MAEKSRVGFIWVYVLIVLFATGIIELIIMPAIQYQLAPQLKTSANMTLNSTDAAEFAVKVDSTTRLMHMGIYAVMFVVLVYGILSIFQKEESAGGF